MTHQWQICDTSAHPSALFMRVQVFVFDFHETWYNETLFKCLWHLQTSVLVSSSTHLFSHFRISRTSRHRRTSSRHRRKLSEWGVMGHFGHPGIGERHPDIGECCQNEGLWDDLHYWCISRAECEAASLALISSHFSTIFHIHKPQSSYRIPPDRYK